MHEEDPVGEIYETSSGRSSKSRHELGNK